MSASNPNAEIYVKNTLFYLLFLFPFTSLASEPYHAKVIAVTDAKIFKKLAELGKEAFKALGGKSLGRIDIKMNHKGVPHFMEANLMPGLRKGYFYRSCVLNLDMSYEDMIFSIAKTGLSSH